MQTEMAQMRKADVQQFEARLIAIETKLNDGRPINEPSHEKSTIKIQNLPFGQNDTEDVNTLLREGLGLRVQTKSIHRARSIYNRAGIITAELNSVDDRSRIMQNKRRLRSIDKYRNVYIESDESVTQGRLEHKFLQLMYSMRNDDQSDPHLNRYNRRPGRYGGEDGRPRSYRHHDPQ